VQYDIIFFFSNSLEVKIWLWNVKQEREVGLLSKQGPSLHRISAQLGS
jgi:hypothetical protein